MTSSADIKFFALADFIIRDGKWLVKRIAFAKADDSKATIVINSRMETRGHFTIKDMQINISLHAMDAIHDNPVYGKEIKIDIKDWEYFLRGQCYHTILKKQNEEDFLIGTRSMSTFMFLQPILHDKIVYVSKGRDVEETVMKHAGK